MFTPHTFVQHVFPPMIGCISSPTVEQICQKNNLSFVELIRPFCTLNVESRLHDPSGSDHLIKNLQICIQDVNDRPTQPSLAKRYLNESVSNASCEVTKAVIVNNSTLDIPVECKWFHSWSKTFFLVQYPSDHEFTKHLLGCLLVTSTIDPPETLQFLLQSLQQMQLVAPSKLPKWFSPNIFKYYVLVHDVKDGDRDKALHFFSTLKSAYGPEHCFFLEINSQQEQIPSTVIHDYWVQYIFNKNQESDGSDYGSSPRTPAEINTVAGMPNTVINEADGILRSGGSPEVAQEASEIQQPAIFHPLSPDLENSHPNISSTDQTMAKDMQRLVNLDVWTSLQGGLQYGKFLTPHDIGNIKSLIKHLVVQVLIPHVEKQIFQLNDLVSNKKGVSRSLLTATKRLFGTSKPSSPGSTSFNSVIYTYDAPELQLRRLGDLYFMFTHYSLAFQAYHAAKRDFAADQAYTYLAGALEMASLAAFMQNDTSKKALDYMEEAILTYLNSCKLPQFATRATLLSSEFLKDRQMFGEAAKQLIRMTSEDSDLRSALLLEQASYCFLNSVKPNMFRKYAFHMVLAGHRFSKAGQRKHALRCYKQAFQVYQNKGWNLAEDHIHFTIGRLAGHLKFLHEGSTSLSSLLSSGSKQTSGQQITYLREYLQMLQEMYKEEGSGDLNILPLPKIEDNSVNVLVSVSPMINLVQAFEPDSPADSIRWARMEELALTECQGAPMIFRLTVHLFSKNTSNTMNPVVVVKETVFTQLSLKNPLQIPLHLLKVRLLWKFHKADGETITNVAENENLDSYIQTSTLESISIEPQSSKQIILTVIALCPGQVDILGIHYSLTCPSGNAAQQIDIPIVQGKQLFIVRGPKLKFKKEQTDVQYEQDYRLNIRVIETFPLLQVQTENFQNDMLSGEIVEGILKLTNLGNAPLKNLYLVTSSPHLFTISKENIISEKIISDHCYEEIVQEYGESFREKNNLYKLIKIYLPNNGILNAEDEIILPLWIRAPNKKSLTRMDILFYYEHLSDTTSPKYRISRFSQTISVHDSLQLSAVVTRSNLCEDKDNMNINLTVKNLNQNGGSLGAVIISIVQISLATCKWELQPKAIFSKDLVLNNQESYSFLVRASRSSDNSSEITDICLQEEKVDSGCTQPYYDFYKWHVYDEKDDSSDNLYKMVLCLRWKGNIIYRDQRIKFVYGQSHVTVSDLASVSVWPIEEKNSLIPNEQVQTLKIFGPERRLNLAKKLLRRVQLENALSYSLIHDRKVKHSFCQKRICRVEMKLILRNCIDCPLRVMINTPGVKYLRPPVTRSQLYTPHSSSIFNWTSRSNALLRLVGNERCNISLAAAFTAPGTYDLGSRLTVAAAMETDTEFTVQLCSIESSIIIFESDLNY